MSEESFAPADLFKIIYNGINAERYLPELDSLPAAERARLEEGSEARNAGKAALGELLVLTKHFGWPDQLPLEKTREEFLARRTAELDEVERRVAKIRAELASL
jgi:hypothetical protein